jgi:hypothetical protein
MICDQNIIGAVQSAITERERATFANQTRMSVPDISGAEIFD